MGNLNKFYLMGRVARAPEAIPGEGEARALIPVVPGTGFRSPRGRGADALLLLAAGPQVGAALALRPGQSVLLRGQLQQEVQRNPDGSERSELVALVQAIDLIADGGPRRPRPPREDRPEGEGLEGAEPQGEDGAAEGEGGAAGGELERSGRRPRRRRRRGPRREGGPREGGPREGGPREGGPREGGPREGPHVEGGEAPARSAPAAPPPPPPPPPRVAPPPDPTYRADMPF